MRSSISVTDPEEIKHAILLLVANCHMDGHVPNPQPFTETREMTITEIKRALHKTYLLASDLNRHDDRGSEKIVNPYHCSDDALITNALYELIYKGLLTLSSQNSHKRYRITKKGASNINDQMLVEAFATGISWTNVKKTLPGQSERFMHRVRREEARTGHRAAVVPVVTLTSVETVVGNVLGVNSPEAKKILSALRENRAL